MMFFRDKPAYPGLDQAFGIEEKFREGQEPPQGGG